MVLALILGMTMLWASPAMAITTISVTTGNFVCDTTHTSVRIRLHDPNGSVLAQHGCRLVDSSVWCVPTNHGAHGVIVIGDDVQFVNLDINGETGPGCGLDAVRVEDVSGFLWSRGNIKKAGGAGLRLVGSVGWRAYTLTFHGTRKGVQGVGAIGGALVGSKVYETAATDAEGITLDCASTGNQIIRSRARMTRAVIRVCDPQTNLVLHSVDDSSENINIGEPAQYAPRWWTVCQPSSFQLGGPDFCHFESLSEALAVVPAGAHLSVDTNKAVGWGHITVDVPDVVIVGLGGRTVGTSGGMKGNYAVVNLLASLTVLAPGVEIHNFIVDGTATVEPTTELFGVTTSQ